MDHDTARWYAALRKPAWTPPSWVFAPVWTTLYAMMAAAFVLTRIPPHNAHPLATRAAWLFAAQLALNLAWSPTFFAARKPALALLLILLLHALLSWTTLTFYRVTPWAGYLLLPYLVWVSLATALNMSIVWLNRGKK